MAGHAASVSQLQQQAETVRGSRPGEVEHGQGALKMSNGVLECQPPGRVGSCLPVCAPQAHRPWHHPPVAAAAKWAASSAG